jgi:ATP-binding cassette subfamily F protein 3
VSIARAVTHQPNILLLDEPTTHLDMASIDALIRALTDYEGTMILVSHDVHFIRAIATSVIHVQSGKITPYAGGYDYFREKSRASGSERAATVASLGNFQPDRAEKKSSDEPKLGLKEIKALRRAEAEARKSLAANRRALEKRVAELEGEIHTLEIRQQELTELLESPVTYDNPSLAMETNRALSGVSAALEKANADWTAAAAKLEEPATA